MSYEVVLCAGKGQCFTADFAARRVEAARGRGGGEMKFVLGRLEAGHVHRCELRSTRSSVSLLCILVQCFRVVAIRHQVRLERNTPKEQAHQLRDGARPSAQDRRLRRRLQAISAVCVHRFVVEGERRCSFLFTDGYRYRGMA